MQLNEQFETMSEEMDIEVRDAELEAAHDLEEKKPQQAIDKYLQIILKGLLFYYYFILN